MFQIAIIKMFDKWGMEGITERIKYLQDYYKPLRDEIEKVVDQYLGGRYRMAVTLELVLLSGYPFSLMEQ